MPLFYNVFLIYTLYYVPYRSHLVATSEGKLNFETFEHLCLLARASLSMFLIEKLTQKFTLPKPDKWNRPKNLAP